MNEPRLDSEVIAATALGQTRSWVLAHPEADIPIESESLLARRERREPLAYILGYREFYGRSFGVEPSVLIPRQETETLIDVLLTLPGRRFLDIGTGSGCLAVTLKLERPTAEVVAIDISQDALKVAQSNAARMDAVVRFVRSDLMSELKSLTFDVIVSNPPYISHDAELQPEVGDFEPPEALYADSNGLEIYRRLAIETPPYLVPGGHLVLELGDGMAEPVIGEFEPLGWSVVGLRNDLSSMPRALVLQRPKTESSETFSVKL